MEQPSTTILPRKIAALRNRTPSRATTRSRRLGKAASRARLWLALYAMMSFTIVGMIIFSYIPKIDVVKYAFYEWEPEAVERFIGWRNFYNAFTQDPLFWQSFKLVVILLVANLIKMWPSIFAAIALHRLRSDRWRYIYQVLFVIPMVIPGMVWLLIWKSFFEADGGIVNRFLNVTGIMNVLHWLDGSPRIDVETGSLVSSGGLPWLAQHVQTLIDAVVRPVSGSVWGLMAFGGMLLAVAPGLHTIGRRWLVWTVIALFSLWAWWDVPYPWGASTPGWWAPATGYLWAPAAFLAATIIARVLRGEDPVTGQDKARWTGMTAIGLGGLLVATAMIWTEPINAFAQGQPSWLGHSRLIVPTLILWGFPWVGTVGVLIYLAGLQQISKDVYEAAELDGVGPLGMMFRIELPLILTQVRINLIFMTIGVLTGYEMNLILFGPEGGTGNAAMVPGLYIYQQSFYESKFGYACALGMVMFVMILLLTIIYQRYVKIEK